MSIAAGHGLHTAASVDTPYYLRDGTNYDRELVLPIYGNCHDAPATANESDP